MIATENSHSLVFGTCDFITRRGKSDFTDVVVTVLEMRDDPGLSRRVQCSHKGPFMGKVRVGGEVRAGASVPLLAVGHKLLIEAGKE